MAFGKGSGKVGASYPGKREKAANVRDINPDRCVGYQNIFINCGTNDLRCENVGSELQIHQLVDVLRDKLMAIKQLCPKASIFVVPVLPSRIHAMNKNIMLYNELVDNMLHSCFPNIWYQGIYSFLDDNGLLSIKLARQGDKIHLGSRGIARLDTYIKTCVFRRGKYSTSSHVKQESAPRVGSSGPP